MKQLRSILLLTAVLLAALCFWASSSSVASASGFKAQQISSQIRGNGRGSRKRPNRLVRAYRAIKKALGFKKSPSAARASYTHVRRSRSFRTSTSRRHSREIVNTPSGLASKATYLAAPAQNHRPQGASRPIDQSQGRQVMAAARGRHPPAKPAPLGKTNGQPLRSTKDVSGGSGIIDGRKTQRPVVQGQLPKPQKIMRDQPGFRIDRGFKVALPNGQQHQQLPNAQYQPAPARPSSNQYAAAPASQYAPAPHRTSATQGAGNGRNQYDSVQTAPKTTPRAQYDAVGTPISR